MHHYKAIKAKCMQTISSFLRSAHQIERFHLCENDTAQIERYPSMRTICRRMAGRVNYKNAKMPLRTLFRSGIALMYMC